MQEKDVLRPRNIQRINLYGLVHQKFIHQHVRYRHHVLAEVKKFIASNIMEKIPNVKVECKDLQIAPEESNTASLKFASESLNTDASNDAICLYSNAHKIFKDQCNTKTQGFVFSLPAGMYLQFEPGAYFARSWQNSRVQVGIKEKSFRPMVVSARDEFIRELEVYFGSKPVVNRLVKESKEKLKLDLAPEETRTIDSSGFLKIVLCYLDRGTQDKSQQILNLLLEHDSLQVILLGTPHDKDFFTRGLANVSSKLKIMFTSNIPKLTQRAYLAIMSGGGASIEAAVADTKRLILMPPKQYATKSKQLNYINDIFSSVERPEQAEEIKGLQDGLSQYLLEDHDARDSEQLKGLFQQWASEGSNDGSDDEWTVARN